MSRLPDFSSSAPPAVPLAGADRAWLAGGALLLLAALLAGVRAQQDLELARGRLDQARSQARSAEARARAGSQRLEPAETELRGQARLGLLAPPSRVLADLEARLPRGVRFERIGLAYGADLRLELQVTAREARDYDRFLEQLEASPRFSELAPGPENRDGELRSSLGLRYVPEPRP